MSNASPVAPERPIGSTPRRSNLRFGRPSANPFAPDRPRARRLLLASFVVGLGVDQALGNDPIGLAGTVLGLLVVVTFAEALRPTGWQRVWLVLAASFTPWFTLRVSPWLIGPNVLAIVGLTALAASGPGTVDTFTSGTRRLRSVSRRIFSGPALLAATTKSAVPTGSPERRSTIIRGLGLGLPLVVLLSALLASGDEFFASLVGLGGVGSTLRRAAVIVLAATVWLALAVGDRRSDVTSGRSGSRLLARIGVGESLVALVLATALLAVYVASTAAAAIGGRAYVEQRTGLTYAEYARSGFFQLVAVVTIVVATLITLRPHIERSTGRRAPLGVGLTLTALTIVIVGVCISRLQTYRSVYGLTMLRFSTTVFAMWLGVVLVLVAASLVWSRVRCALVGAVVLAACITLGVVNAVNPEAVVARENIGRSGSITKNETLFDDIYLAEGLTDDSVPDVVARLGRLRVEERALVLQRICRERNERHGWSWNFSRWQANEARRKACR